ncbi:hypothetical protein FDECE_2880 [Fusarium decemcellulare]|nr:hypothetical protein FDECE_2880 [Fusarium decemcellulare]
MYCTNLAVKYAERLRDVGDRVDTYTFTVHVSATEFQTEEQESDPDGYDEAVIDPALREAFFGSIDFVGSVDQHLKSQHGFSEAQLAPHRYPTCNRCKESKSLTYCVNLKDRNELNTRRLACRDLQNAPSRAWTRFRSMSRSTSASPAPPAPSKRNVSAVQSPEHPARRGVQPTSPEPGMSRLLILPQPAQTEPPALAGPPLRRRVASAPSSKMPKMHPQDTTCRRLLRNFMQRTASGIEFFRRDQRSQDTLDEAQARAETFANTSIGTDSRAAQPSSPVPTPSPAQSPALSRSQSQGTLGTAILSPIEAGDGDDDDFVCELCVNQRPNQARIHASTRREFLLTDGGQTIYYRACSRADGTDDVQSPVASSLPDSDTDVSSPGPIDNRRRRQGAAPPSSLSQSEAASEDILPDPAFNDQLNQPCLTVRDRKLIANWQEAMGTHVMQYCPQCKIKWFNLNM